MVKWVSRFIVLLLVGTTGLLMQGPITYVEIVYPRNQKINDVELVYGYFQISPFPVVEDTLSINGLMYPRESLPSSFLTYPLRRVETRETLGELFDYKYIGDTDERLFTEAYKTEALKAILRKGFVDVVFKVEDLLGRNGSAEKRQEL